MGEEGEEIVGVLARLFESRAEPAPFDAALDAVLGAFGCATGTIHRFDDGAGLLRLAAQRGLPEPLLPIVRAIPVGKGMAGRAAARREPVQVCNLQTDASGVANRG